MDVERSNRIEALFNAVVELPSGRRSEFLRSACAGEKELAAEVESLLAADGTAGAYLDQSAYSGGSIGADGHEAGDGLAMVGRTIGGYRLVRRIASGGMGIVYEAVQSDPQRSVALKLMRAAATSTSAFRRFRHEAQILGGLRHHGIAQIYEAGVHEEGPSSCPFFAMEYFPDAMNLRDYARRRQPNDRQRLELLRQIVEAVHHAHSKGVIHRDLKPANILVVHEDPGGDGCLSRPAQTKILDFGVARLIEPDGITTLQTDDSQWVGTLPYMSPEQIATTEDGIDARSDVYALGVIAYELLTGRLPYEIADKPLLEAARIIHDCEPIRPSTIRGSLRGDLETILLKALEKDRDRRYGSAAELSADIGRCQRDEPIMARRASAWYLFSKFTRRRRALVVGVALAAVGLFGGGVAASWQAYRATMERNHAILEAKKARRINEFLLSTLSAADPAVAGPDVTIREVLDRAATNAEVSLDDEPVVRAAVHHTIGAIYQRLGRNDEAIRELRRAADEYRRMPNAPDVDLASALTDLAWAVFDRDPVEAERLFSEALVIRRAQLPVDHPHTINTMVYLASARAANGEGVEGECLVLEALPMLKRLRGEEHRDVAYALFTLGQCVRAQGRLDDADTLFREAIAMQKKTLGPDHLQLGFSLRSLASLTLQRGRDEEAAGLNVEAAAIIDKKIGNPGVHRIEEVP